MSLLHSGVYWEEVWDYICDVVLYQNLKYQFVVDILKESLLSLKEKWKDV